MITTDDLQEFKNNSYLTQPPFSLLTDVDLCSLLSDAEVLDYEVGSRLLRPDQVSDRLFYIIKGNVRLLGISPYGDGQVTLDLSESHTLYGWLSLLRAQPSEFLICSSQVKVLSIAANCFMRLYLNHRAFSNYFNQLTSIFENYGVACANITESAFRLKEWESLVLSKDYQASVCTIESSSHELPAGLPVGCAWYLSTPDVQDHSVGSLVESSNLPLRHRKNFNLPIRLISLPIKSSQSFKNSLNPHDSLSASSEGKVFLNSDHNSTVNLESLGIFESDKNLLNHYPSSRNANSNLKYSCFLIKHICDYLRVPFKSDLSFKLIDQQIKRNKLISMDVLGRISELMGLETQIGQCDVSNFANVQTPAFVLVRDKVNIYWGRSRGLIFGNPSDGNYTLKDSELVDALGEQVKFIVISKSSSTPETTFGWSWFIPLINKYKKSLALVFVASLLAQMFALAIPLLIQQIIDKTLSQGNLSSLNILGGTMIVLALFQGILQVLRTYVFVDTTDRLDLALGSSVITRLLSLPLSYFEKRPVGELSQRLGELNSIRSFLTGTALISVLNIIFALIYLVIMFVYSAPLSLVALSTVPIYIFMIVCIAPIYKSLIRKRAVAQARTQSHLIEIIGGIQTVKAQHFELNARWKWQDRYRNFVDQGFKSTALGAASGEFGSFLTQFSGLAVLWYGMSLVLNGELSLGQLIAFRIISGMVIGPILQLAGLYQGFQSVQLSMERLSDIVDQPSEFQLSSKEGTQIALPHIIGDVEFRNVCFSFNPNSTSLQLSNVSLSISAGSFVGVVGKSGSGKSTLMKLLPRLYEPKSGSIHIDDYDVCKVDLSSLRRQVGIVPQDSLLFEGTVAENIALNDPDASTEVIIQASKIACSHEFIMSLPDGYATQLSEKGSNISGGQRQRIAIARTILSNPQLLVLDEATSALDFETERQLCLNLQNWANGKTVFFITHRLSTIRNADSIIFMDSSKIVETGTHEELISQKGLYYALYRHQVD